MYHPSQSVINAQHARAAALVKSHAAQLLAINTIPADGVVSVPSVTAPGVNATFGGGVSPADFALLRAGKKLYIHYSARPASGAVQVHGGHVFGGTPAWAAHYAPSPANALFAKYPGVSLFDLNQAMSRAVQLEQQRENRQGNIDAITSALDFAAIVTAGASGAAADAATATTSEVAGTTIDLANTGTQLAADTGGVATGSEFTGATIDLANSGTFLEDAGLAGSEGLGAAAPIINPTAGFVTEIPASAPFAPTGALPDSITGQLVKTGVGLVLGGVLPKPGGSAPAQATPAAAATVPTGLAKYLPDLTLFGAGSIGLWSLYLILRG